MRKTLFVRSNVKRILIFAAVVAILLSVIIFGAISSLSDVAYADEGEMLANGSEGYMHYAEDVTALELKDSDITYDSSAKSFSFSIHNTLGKAGTGIAKDNISLTWSSKDRDYENKDKDGKADEGFYYKTVGNQEKPDGYGFSVENHKDYGSYNEFGAVL
ncbi:MAG: hypothetical protein NC303_05535, partial [Firmicutes bacterium]|nr:hypothetical protein [Bacillota bacterium]